MSQFWGSVHAAALYSLAFLLTERSELSLEITREVLDSQDEADFFSSPSLAQLRRIVVEKAVAAIREELAASVRQTASLPLVEVCLPPSTWSLDSNTTKLQVESALLAIDTFPRCALLLTVFEGLSRKEASVLLSSDRELTAKGQVLGLWDLTNHLARMQGWNPSAMGLTHASFESDSRSLWSES